jgi:prepilin-type N-terminal cleavage/methylation domain-containing protein
MHQDYTDTSKYTHKAGSKGFTIIELLIATVVFSIVLVVVLAAFVQTSRLFYKGVNMDNTQEDTRTITQDIADDLKFSQGPPTFPPGAPSPFIANSSTPSNQQYFCIGLHRYDFQIGHQLGSTAGPSDYGIKRVNVSSADCPSPTVFPGNNPDEMLDAGMQLNAVGINCSNGRCSLNVHVLFFGGDHDLFSTQISSYSSTPWLAPDAQCTGSLQDSQFCAVADYNRTISLIEGA